MKARAGWFVVMSGLALLLGSCGNAQSRNALGGEQAVERAMSTSTPGPAEATISCADGGWCKVGDRGPGGGTVFYDAGSDQPWGRFLEVAPVGWFAGAADPKAEWCDAFTTVATNPGIGAGATNTAAIIEACGTSNAAGLVAGYRGGGRQDWALPSQDELDLLWLSGSAASRLSATPYWSSSLAGRPAWAWVQVFDTNLAGAKLAYPADMDVSVRPVRAFGCLVGGPCRIGDRGPGGGTVFYDAGSPQSWGRYLEAAPPGWNGTPDDPRTAWCPGGGGPEATAVVLGAGKANTVSIVRECGGTSAAGLAMSFRGEGLDDWFLPSADELAAAWPAASTAGFLAQDYWTSSSISGQLSDSVTELCTSEAVSVSMSTGTLDCDNREGVSLGVRPVRAF